MYKTQRLLCIGEKHGKATLWTPPAASNTMEPTENAKKSNWKGNAFAMHCMDIFPLSVLICIDLYRFVIDLCWSVVFWLYWDVL